MTSLRASIIVRCYNEREHIGKLLHGVFEQTMQDFEVIIVDSGSTDGTLEVAKQYPIDDIVFIDPAEFSFGRALNYGCEAASGDFCVIASAHVYPERADWLEKLLEKFDDDEVGLVYGKQRGNDVTTFSEKQIFRQWFPDHDIEHQESPFCNNANAAIRRELWEEFQYNEELTGLEDVDMASRLQNEGYEISYSSEASVIHVHDETAREIFNRYRREAFAHRQIIPDHEFTAWDFVKLFVTNALSDYRTAIRERELLGNAVEIPYFRLLQFLGTWRGFNQERPAEKRLWQRFYYPDRDGYPPRPEREESSREGRTSSEEKKIDYSDVDIDDETVDQRTGVTSD